jgi:hypothetical protein
MPGFEFKNKETYYWQTRVHATDTVGDWSAMRSFSIAVMPGTYRLDQNYPNPFNPVTVIGFSLPDEMEVIIEVINILGERIKTIVHDRFPAGEYREIWDGTDNSGERVASGVYFYRLRSDDFTMSRKMVLLK